MILENVHINRVGNVRKGTSAATGKEWQAIDVTLGFEDETGNSYIFATVSPEIWEKLGYKEGDVVTLCLRCRTRPFSNGFIANEIRIMDPETLKES